MLSSQPSFAVGIRIDDVVVVGIPVAVDDFVADSAVPRGLRRMRGGEPVQHIHAVAILLHNATAGVFHPVIPEAELRDFRRIRRLETGHGRATQNPVTGHLGELADLARAQDLLRSPIFRTVALLETELDGLRRIGLFGGAQHALDARHIGAGRLFAVDMLAGARGGFEMLRMQEDGRSDQHGVDIRLAQQFLIPAVSARGGGTWNFGLGLIDAVGEEVANGRQPGTRIARHVGAHIPAAPAGSDDAERHGRVGLRAECDPRLEDHEIGGRSRESLAPG
jgi:hypothetical protein